MSVVPRSSARRTARSAPRHVSVGDVRGLGLFTTLELVYDRDTRSELFPLTGPAGPADAQMRQHFAARGLSAALRGPWLFANPPLVVETDQIDFALSVFDEALEFADTATSSRGAEPPPHLA